MSDLVWPHRLLRPKTLGWSIGGASVDGGRPLGGRGSQRSVFGGGGLFVARLTEIVVRKREQSSAWLALEALLDNGATSIVIPRCDRRHSPIGRDATLGGVPHSDGAGFSDGSLYVGGVVASKTIGAAAFRDTSIVLDLVGGRPLIGGEHFSIEHPTVGWRIYRVGRLLSSTPIAGGVRVEIEFRCPLREDVPAGTAIEWTLPRCLMRLADPDGMAIDLELLRFARPSVTFVEVDQS